MSKTKNYSSSEDDSVESFLLNNMKEEDPLEGENMKCFGLHNKEKRTYLIDWSLLFLLGTITNFGYVVVNSSAQNIADDFGKSNLLGLIPWANVFFGFFIRGLNTFALEKIAYKWKVIANGIAMLIGFLFIAVAVKISFWVCLLSIVVIGTTSSFGESVILAFLRLYPSTLIDGWSSGTGMAGVAGSLYYLCVVALGVNLSGAFGLLIPTVIIYGLSYWAISPPNPELLNINNNDNNKNNESQSINDPDSKTVPETKMQMYTRCIKLVANLAIQLGLVYCFEYVISTGLAAKAEDPDYASSSQWVIKNSYAVLSFCYQLGVLISRSSLKFIKIKRVEILTVLQGINLILWILQAYFKFINIYIQFPLMIYVGLLGGASYVNIFYRILQEDFIPKKDKDFCVNIAAIAQTTGITIACILDLVFDATFLKDK